jgi:hypothetical protein
MTDDNKIDLEKITDELTGFTTSEGNGDARSEESVNVRPMNKKRVKQLKEEREDSTDNRKEIHTQRYSDTTIFAEAVLISGVPSFLVLDKIHSTISINLVIDLGFDTSEIYRPYESASYMNRPYSFSSKEQVNEYIEKVKDETLDSLYKKVKAVWKKYVDADDFHISICAADTIYTYYQDRLGLTHYLFFVGGNNSGKSNNLTVFQFLAYRNITSSDMTYANIYQFLGSTDEGIGTICEDEADNIDSDRDKMCIYKNGYTTGRPVLRTDTSFGRKQLKLNTFCFKAFAAERLPDSVRAKGFNQRIIELNCSYGFPKYDISEVANPAGEERYQNLLNELEEIRNTLLIFRLQHYNDKIPDVNLNICNREKQLFKPVIRVFQKTETLKELLPIISEYVNQKRVQNASSLHAYLFKIIIDLIKENNAYELASGSIWNRITDPEEGLEGNVITAQTFMSVEFGSLSQKDITQTLEEVFGAVKSKSHKKGRKLIFNQKVLDKLDKIYNLDVDIQVVEGEGGTHGTHGTHVGLDGYTSEESRDKENEESEDKSIEIASRDNISQILLLGKQVSPASPASPFTKSCVKMGDAFCANNDNVSPASPNEPAETIRLDQDFFRQVKESIFRIGRSDRWGCKHCKIKDDIWFMEKHKCSGLLKIIEKASRLKTNGRLPSTDNFNAIKLRS